MRNSIHACVALILVAAALLAVPQQALKELIILHTNDMHAHVLGVMPNDSMCTPRERSDEKCLGGFDRIYTQVHLEREQHKNILLLDAGDQFQGTMFHQLYKGLASAKFMNAVGYDAMAVGNHEFDNGPQALARFIDEIKFPMLSANIDASQSPELKNKIKSYIIINKNNMRVGVVGYTTEDTAFLSNPGTKIRFKPIIPSVREAVAALKKQKVDVIIALSHAGLARDIQIAKAVSGIAAIVCGHSNSLLSNKLAGSDGPAPLVIQSPKKEPVLLVSAYAYGKYLGRLQFSFDSHGVPRTWAAEPLVLDNKIERNSDIASEALKLYEPIAAYEKQLVGVASVELDGRECRYEECIMGNFVSDAMLFYTRKMGIDIALMNAGGLRASIPQGPVNRAQLREVLPFEKKIVLVKLKGSIIGQIIEHGVSYAEDKKNDNTGRFLQVAGVKYVFNPAKKRGMRVEKIEVFDRVLKKYAALEPERIYGVVTNSYLADGGDDYHFFAQATEHWSMDIELKELLSIFFKSPLSQLPRREGRIVRLKTQK